MRKIAILLLVFGGVLDAAAQDSMEKVMEQRAREMYRVIGLNDESAWKKFVTDNYTQALIDRPMTAKRSESTDGNTTTSSSAADQSGNNVENKARMFQMLHGDFGSSKLVSIKPSGQTLEMVLDNGMGIKGTFQLKFEKNKPYLIDGIGVQAGN